MSSLQSFRTTSEEKCCISGLFYIFTLPGEGVNRLTLFGILIMCICSSLERARDLERERDRGEISKRGMSEAAKKGEKAEGRTDRFLPGSRDVFHA